MPIVRLALEGDLESLMELFAASEVSDHAQPIERAREIWAETIPATRPTYSWPWRASGWRRRAC
jgi:hypothetical protein